MALQGSLDTLYLNSILQMLRNDKKSGLFRAFNDRDEVTIYFSNGEVIYATGSHNNIRLGQLLLKAELISADQLQDCLKEAETQTASFGKYLVENHHLSAENLRMMLHKQTEELILQLFFWEKGQFEYRDAQINVKGLVPAKINIMKIILDATRKIDELAVLKKHLPGDDVILQVSKQIKNRKEIKLTTNELQILTLVNGKQTIGELIQSIDDGPLVTHDKFSIYKFIFSLLSSGLIEPVSSKGYHTVEMDCNTIVTVYNDILQVMRSRLEADIGRQTNQLLLDGKIKIDSASVNLLENFDPNEPAATNMQRITEALESIEDPSDGRDRLIQQFNRYITNILKCIPDLLGVAYYNRLVEEINKVLWHVSLRSARKIDMAPIIDSLQEEIVRIGYTLKGKSNTK